LRSRTLIALRIGKHLVKTGDLWALDIPAADTKTRRPLDYPISKELCARIDLYLERFRRRIPAGIGLAIVIAVIEFLWDGWRPYSAVLGRADGVEGYHDVTRYPSAHQIPGLVLFRWDAPLFFANAELFKERVLDAVVEAPSPVRWLVVTAEPVTSVDVTAADALAELDGTLHDAGIELCFAELKDPVKDKLRRFGLFAQIGDSSFFPTIGAAVGGYLKAHAVDWVDWKDRSLATKED